MSIRGGLTFCRSWGDRQLTFCSPHEKVIAYVDLGESTLQIEKATAFSHEGGDLNNQHFAVHVEGDHLSA